MMPQGLLLLLAMLEINAIETGIIWYINDKKICFEKKYHCTTPDSTLNLWWNGNEKFQIPRNQIHLFLMYKSYSFFLVNHSDYTCFCSIYRNARCHQVVPGDSSQCILPSCAPLCDEDCVFLDCHDGHCQWNDIPCTDTDHGSQTLRPLCKQEQTVSTYMP